MKKTSQIFGLIIVICTVVIGGYFWIYLPWTKKQNAEKTEAPAERGEYSITYNLNGGENSARNVDSYNKGDVVTLYPARRSGYLFAGWYDEQNNKVETLENIEEDKVLKAVWQAEQYEIRYYAVLNGTAYDILDSKYDFLLYENKKYPTSYYAGQDLTLPTFKNFVTVREGNQEGEYAVLGYYADKACTTPLALVNSGKEYVGDLDVYLDLRVTCWGFDMSWDDDFWVE